MRKKLFIISVFLILFSEYLQATCTPTTSLNLSRPARDYPDCVYDSHFLSYGTCTNFIKNYTPPLGFGRIDCVSTPENNDYSNPKVNLKSKLCLFGICGTTDLTIAKDNCAWFGIIRYCARFTPNDKGTPLAGWNNPPKFLNNCPSSNTPPSGTPSYPPRLCVFEDSMDGADTNPSYSPYHNNQPGPGNAPQNQIVEKNVGCIDLPLAPGPPPYCPSINYYPQANTNRFCSINESPTIDNDCVVGQMVDSSASLIADRYQHNSFFTPRARIGYSNFLPICQDSTQTNCAQLKKNTTDPVLFALPCNIAPAGSPACVNLVSPIFPILDKYASGTVPFRVLYNIIGPSNNLLLSQTYWRDLSSYPGYNSTVSGIDIGDYSDISLVYNTPSTDPTIGTDAQTTSAIVQYFSSDQTPLAIQSQFELCVNPATDTTSSSPYEINSLGAQTLNLYSFSRSPMPYPPIVGRCGEVTCGQQVNCQSSPSDPRLVICLKDESGNTQIGILSKSFNPKDGYNSFDSDSSYYLFGTRFDILITDDNYAGMGPNYYPNPTTDPTKPGVCFDSNLAYKSGATQVCAIGYSNPNKLRIAKALYVTPSSSKGYLNKSYNIDPSAVKFASFAPKDVLTILTSSSNNQYYSKGDFIQHASGYLSSDIDPSLEVARPNTAYEDGLCISISSYCPADSSTAGYNWNSAQGGTTQTGTCKAGYSTADGGNPSRPCVTTGDITSPGAITDPCVPN